MSRAHQPADAAARTDLLGRLGLAGDADDPAAGEAHDRIVAFLDGAPDELRPWADRRRREADRVLELLSGAGAGPARAPARRRPLPRPAMWAIGLLAGLGVVFGVYELGRPPSDPPAVASTQAGTRTPAPVDEAKVAELMVKLKADPQDLETLKSLSNLYFAAADYPRARGFLERILAVDPTNERALVGAGAAAFNAGDVAAAEQVWTRAVQLYPDNPELRYDLGFLYLGTGRPDLMASEWQKVLELAPDSELAATVRSHTAGAASPTPTPGR